MAQRQIPPRRKVICVLGMGLLVVGALFILSVFLSSALHFGDFSNMVERSRSLRVRAILGISLATVGGVLRAVGRAGRTGSVNRLDTEEAGTVAELRSRERGGMVKDALEEAGIRMGCSPEADDIPFDEKLRRLQKLREDGIISAQKFEAAKRKILEDA